MPVTSSQFPESNHENVFMLQCFLTIRAYTVNAVMGVLGAVASVLTVLEVAIKVTRLFEKINNAPAEVKALANEVGNIYQIANRIILLNNSGYRNSLGLLGDDESSTSIKKIIGNLQNHVTRLDTVVAGILGRRKQNRDGQIHVNRLNLLNSRCRGTGEGSMNFNYVFPSWAFQRALCFSYTWDTLNGMDGQLAFRIPRILHLDDTNSIYAILRTSSVPQLQMYMERRKIRPFDLDDRGRSLAHTAAWAQNYKQ
ncbi:hypothetical protein K469DRAFT_692896 [Zopfia rhizophila CBS 207.26]|uniref:Fungal N-terminal domain-containing protein n=1 Tax=Zopfia rhizophila CBS 207.26 TaxID=1314779 RepID=A0A6A6DN07_9PEZI|nr:hypothetical protein K469DRAFT_692896 [Zopfia rhizophila CBS 207.26]